MPFSVRTASIPVFLSNLVNLCAIHTKLALLLLFTVSTGTRAVKSQYFHSHLFDITHQIIKHCRMHTNIGNAQIGLLLVPTRRGPADIFGKDTRMNAIEAVAARAETRMNAIEAVTATAACQTNAGSTMGSRHIFARIGARSPTPNAHETAPQQGRWPHGIQVGTTRRVAAFLEVLVGRILPAGRIHRHGMIAGKDGLGLVLF